MATGLAIATAISATLEVGGEIAAGIERHIATEQALKALSLQEKETTVQYQQKTLANYNRMQQYLSAQTAEAVTRGVGFNSASFNAIQRNTVNVTAREQKNLDVDYQIAKSTFAAKREAANEQFWGGTTSDILNVGSMVAGYTYYAHEENRLNQKNKNPNALTGTDG